MTALKERYSKNKDVKFLKGHLLNHDLGGRAIPENLFPITYEANSKHKTHVEHPVENMLYKSKNKNQYVHYIVNVDVKSKNSQRFYPQMHPKCEFKCEWYLKDKNYDTIIDKDDEKIVSSAGYSHTYKKRDFFNKIRHNYHLCNSFVWFNSVFFIYLINNAYFNFSTVVTIYNANRVEKTNTVFN